MQGERRLSRRAVLRAALAGGSALWAIGAPDWTMAQYIVAVGDEELLLSRADLAGLGLRAWPDGILGAVCADDGCTFFGPNVRSIARTLGSLEAPAQRAVEPSIGISSMKHTYQYAAGGPVYYDADSGTLLLVYHAERWPGGASKFFYSLLGMARSLDGGSTWQDMGEIVSPELPFSDMSDSSTEVGGGPLVVAGDYFYVYFRDRLAAGTNVNLAVARALRTDVLAAATGGYVASWTKYADGGWQEPGLGGRSSALEVGNPASRWFDASYCAPLQSYVMVVSSGTPVDLYLMCSPDGLNWSGRQRLTNQSGELFYPSLIGPESGTRIFGDAVYVYYTSSAAGGFARWSDAVLARRLLTFNASSAA